jgi:hypothetical protein
MTILIILMTGDFGQLRCRIVVSLRFFEYHGGLNFLVKAVIFIIEKRAVDAYLARQKMVNVQRLGIF